jgi:hypothetical protein
MTLLFPVLLSEALQRNAKHEARLLNIQLLQLIAAAVGLRGSGDWHAT